MAVEKEGERGGYGADLGEQRRAVGEEIRQREGGCRGEQVDGEKVASVPLFLLSFFTCLVGQAGQGHAGDVQVGPEGEAREAGAGSGGPWQRERELERGGG